MLMVVLMLMVTDSDDDDIAEGYIGRPGQSAGKMPYRFILSSVHAFPDPAMCALMA